MTTSLTKKAAAAVMIASLLVPSLAFAQTGAGVNANVQTTGVSATASTTVKIDAKGERAKTKAAQEIDRRVAALQALAARVNAMTKVTPELKANINTVVQNQSQAFAQLKVKIAADTDLTVLRTDIKSITDSYRIYALIIPQANIIAASDRIVTLNSMLNGVGMKLKARLEAAQAAGADVTALATTLVELGGKIDSANAHAQAAVNGTVSLVPDEGDKTKMEANQKALKDARAEIVAAHKDIADARKVISAIVSGLAKLQVNASATGSAGVGQ